MSAVLDLLRPELRQLKPYPVGERTKAAAWQNANEVPWSQAGDTQALNRYPEPQSHALRQRLADNYAVDVKNVLLTRGSDDAIDLLIRMFCRPGIDAIVTLPPTFSMYAQFALLNNVRVYDIPLVEKNNFSLDIEQIIAGCKTDNAIKLVFVCSPNNPTGNLQTPQAISALCRALQGQALVVVDEAYQEFANTTGCTPLLTEHDNLVVLRTLSKAHALAAIRCGVLLGASELVTQLQALLPPYPMPKPTINAALEAMQADRLFQTRQLVTQLLSEREALRQRLADLPAVKKVWPSDANFLLVETHNAAQFSHCCASNNIHIRVMSDDALAECVRITVGTKQQNQQLVQVLESLNVAA